MTSRFALLLAALLGVASVTRAAEPATQPVVLPRSEQFDLASYGGQTHRIFIAAPSGEPGPDGYAVLYVLDANAMFLTAVEVVRFQRGLEPTIVVGIGHPTDATVDQRRRFRDFSPLTPLEKIRQSASGPPVSEIVTGGEDEFLDFVERTLKPEIARRFPVNPDRAMLFGHSLAGRLVLHAMFTRPGSFRAYLAASPSIWWNDRSILQEAEAYVARHGTDDPPVDVLITVGEMEQRLAPGTKPERAEFLTMARMVDNARDLAERIRGIESPVIRVEFVEYPGENHGSVVPSAISRGVRFALQKAAPPAVLEGE